ncbi:hypothetical protein A1O3_06986 [Capronia epimyces CBS 606.96]|uniref:Uncharacterized protein n=1 Tax=Capronia epimyces CBS 606.96 TaxID=1182542 RepID=W9XJK5_9EURO|nr:uncharacterized protein A1O3_06986 [Capronia epimyces CBS 606.96]EXJ80702.1 hypothetical protein A1O3_06986 [Capronia epimyces CBS 606.96]
MQFVNAFSNLQLDIVGIVAVLGEGSTARNAQASALSWHHILPRLLPAPQALLKHEQEKRLPTQKGTVVGAYSGNIRFELNFFSQLLHPDKLRKFEVELVRVEKKKPKPKPKNKPKKKKTDSDVDSNSHSDSDSRDSDSASASDMPAYDVKKFGYLAALSVLGCLMSIVLFGLSIHYDDGFALVATVLLSFTSTTVGFASWWKLDFEEEKPKPGREVPDGDLVIYYPRQGAFRVVRCDEIVSRLYFKAELCETLLDDDWYRIVALASAVFLLAGLLCLGNSQPIMQMAFAASYILLNVLHWASSALNPLTHHWEHNYDLELLKVKPPIQVDPKRQPQPPTSLLQSPPQPLPLPLSPSTDGTGPPFHTFTTTPTNNPVGVMFASPVASPTASPRPSTEPGSAGAANDNETSNDNSNDAAVDTLRKRAEVRFQLNPPALQQKGATNLDADADVEARRPSGAKPSRRLSTASMARSAFNLGLGRKGTSSSQVSVRPEMPKEVANYTAALWTAIALTGSVRWLNKTNIVPDNAVWDEWVDEAGRRAAPKWRLNQPHHQRGDSPVPTWYLDSDGCVNLPLWDYQGRLGQLFKDADAKLKNRPELPRAVQHWLGLDRLSDNVKLKLRTQLQNARQRLANRSSE